MAIVRGGLFSIEAKGQVAKTLNFQTLKGENVCGRFHKPGGSPSDLQVFERNFGSFVKALPTFYYAQPNEVMPNWKASLRIGKVKNTFLGQLLRQTRHFMPVIYGNEGVRITKVKVVYEGGVFWDFHSGTNYRDVVPLWTRFTTDSAHSYVYSWGLRGWRRSTKRAYNFGFNSVLRPKTGFKYAVVYVKTQSSEEFPIMSYCFDWTQTEQGRKGGGDSEEDEDEKIIVPEK